jgi:hypothetical protein
LRRAATRESVTPGESEVSSSRWGQAPRAIDVVARRQRPPKPHAAGRRCRKGDDLRFVLGDDRKADGVVGKNTTREVRNAGEDVAHVEHAGKGRQQLLDDSETAQPGKLVVRRLGGHRAV